MTSSRPYLLRALHEWIIDNDMTPHILVDAGVAGVEVPLDYVDDGKIVFNVSPGAVQGLCLGNSSVEFDARFSGQPVHVYVPVPAVLAVYARENGRGMVFSDDMGGDEPPPEKPDGGGSRPALKLVK